jgi:hypothetical protein
MSRKDVWMIAMLIVLMLAFGVSYAYPRDDGRYAGSPLKEWFNGLKSDGGGLCCSVADGVALEDPDWDTKDRHYRVRIDGQWINVPDDTVIKEPNRSGKTIVWPWRGPAGTTVRCFMPGSMT